MMIMKMKMMNDDDDDDDADDDDDDDDAWERGLYILLQLTSKKQIGAVASSANQ